MAELDYALLADYAQIEGGKLSVLGGSYTHAESSNKGLWLLTVAGRVRTSVDEGPVSLGIRIVAAGGVEYTSNFVLDANEANARPYGDGRVGILFASSSALPIVTAGLWEIFVSLDDVECRRLAFDMSVVG
jgi:hypothetical protein